MWIIKDVDLKNAVNTFFTDSEVEASFLHSETDQVTLFKDCPDRYNVTFIISKDQFMCLYDQYDWNAFPDILPPTYYGERPWLVQRKNGDPCVACFMNTSERGRQWVAITSSASTIILRDVIAFRKLPEPV